MSRKVTPKSKAWDALSKLVRLEGCLRTTGLRYVGDCVTCGKRYHFRYLQAGHCFSGRRNSVLLVKKFIDIQCNYCNMILHGKPKVFREVMNKRFGKDFVERWRLKLKKKTIPDVNINWAARKERYKRMFEAL